MSKLYIRYPWTDRDREIGKIKFKGLSSNPINVSSYTDFFFILVILSSFLTFSTSTDSNCDMLVVNSVYIHVCFL